VIGVVLAGVLAAAPPQTSSPTNVSLFGAGSSESCAAWLSSPAKESEGFAWIMGFWTGMNDAALLASQNPGVGHSTDGWGIVGEIKKLCTREPSAILWAASARVYQEFKRDGR
jgi:hypothetical protein